MASAKTPDKTGTSRLTILKSAIKYRLSALFGGRFTKPRAQLLPSLTFLCDRTWQVAACIALANARCIPYTIVFPSDYHARIIAKRSPRTFDHLELEMEFAGELVIAVADRPHKQVSTIAVPEVIATNA